MGRSMLFVLVLTVFSTVQVGAATVCGCVSMPSNESPEQIYIRFVSEYDAVFLGRVDGFENKKGVPLPDPDREKRLAATDKNYETKMVRFKIERWWKGGTLGETLLATDELDFGDGRGSNTSCNYHFRKDETYLVFAKQRSGALRTHSCAPTRLLKSSLQIIEFLGEGIRPLLDRDN